MPAKLPYLRIRAARVRTATAQDVVGLAASSSPTVSLCLSARQAATAERRMACTVVLVAASGWAAVQPVRRGRRRRRRRLRGITLRLFGASLSQEAVTAHSAARQYSATSYRAQPLPGRRTTKRTALTTGSTGIQTAAAADTPPAGSLPAPERPARPQPAISTGTGSVATWPASTPTTRPRLHRASPRGVHTAAPRGRTRT